MLLQRIQALEQELNERAPTPAAVPETFQVYATRTGGVWPQRFKEGAPLFVGLKHPPGAAAAAMRAILPKIFGSIGDAATFFNNGQRRQLSAAELTRGMKRCGIHNLDAAHLLFDLDIKQDDGISVHRFLEAFRWDGAAPGPTTSSAAPRRPPRAQRWTRPCAARSLALRRVGTRSRCSLLPRARRRARRRAPLRPARTPRPRACGS